MPTITDRLGLVKPGDADEFVTEDIAANWQAIADSTAGWLPSDTLADRPDPSADIEGFLFWAYDDGQVYLCTDVDGTGTYGWRSLGTIDHAQLSGRDELGAHADLFLEDDHTKDFHDLQGLDAGTLQGTSREVMGHALIRHNTTISNSHTNLSTSYKEVTTLNFTPPGSWNTYRLSAHAIAWIRFGDNAQAHIIIGGNTGTVVNIPTDCAPSPSHSVSGLSGSTSIGFRIKGSGAPEVYSRSMFYLAHRES